MNEDAANFFVFVYNDGRLKWQAIVRIAYFDMKSYSAD